MLAATALVLLMTPALGLFYAGLVRAKNSLNTFMMCLGALAVALVMWVAVGYSLAFDDGVGLVGGLLWFGWFGFNGGSGFTAGKSGALAFTNTLLTPSCTLLTWIILDLVRSRQATAIGAATAIVVGCVGITPAAGFISPIWAMVLGVL